jgi:hypothetical protein
MLAPAALLEVDVAAPEVIRGISGLQQFNSTPRFRRPSQPPRVHSVGARLCLRTLDAMIPSAVATAKTRTIAALALDCLTVPTELLPVPPRYLIRAEPVPIPTSPDEPAREPRPPGGALVSSSFF